MSYERPRQNVRFITLLSILITLAGCQAKATGERQEPAPPARVASPTTAGASTTTALNESPLTTDTPAATALPSPTAVPPTPLPPTSTPAFINPPGISAAAADFWLTVQQNIIAGDRTAVARVVQYPLHECNRLPGRVIADTTAFVAAYDDIVTDTIRTNIEAQTLEELFVNWQGIAAARGELWFSSYSNGIRIAKIGRFCQLPVAPDSSAAQIDPAVVPYGTYRFSRIEAADGSTLPEEMRTRFGNGLLEIQATYFNVEIPNVPFPTCTAPSYEFGAPAYDQTTLDRLNIPAIGLLNIVCPLDPPDPNDGAPYCLFPLIILAPGELALYRSGALIIFVHVP